MATDASPYVPRDALSQSRAFGLSAKAAHAIAREIAAVGGQGRALLAS